MLLPWHTVRESAHAAPWLRVHVLRGCLSLPRSRMEVSQHGMAHVACVICVPPSTRAQTTRKSRANARPKSSEKNASRSSSKRAGQGHYNRAWVPQHVGALQPDAASALWHRTVQIPQVQELAQTPTTQISQRTVVAPLSAPACWLLCVCGEQLVTSTPRSRSVYKHLS